MIPQAYFDRYLYGCVWVYWSRMLFGRFARSFVFSLAVVLLVAACVCGFMGNPSLAWAEDPKNEVDLQQIPDTSFIYDTPIEDLVKADSHYDGQQVQVRGEAIGERIWQDAAHTMAWVSLVSVKDGQDLTISVLMPAEMADKIDTYGRYGATGSIVQVKGVFHLVDSEHDGASDIVASDVQILAPGQIHKDEFKPMDFVPGIILVAIGLGLTYVFRRAREKGR